MKESIVVSWGNERMELNLDLEYGPGAYRGMLSNDWVLEVNGLLDSTMYFASLIKAKEDGLCIEFHGTNRSPQGAIDELRDALMTIPLHGVSQ